MRLLVDVNLSPDWVSFFQDRGIDAVHWISIGEPSAADRQIMEWARKNNCIVFTHDLDFGALHAMTQSTGPSVIQVRCQDVMPAAIGESVVRVLGEHQELLEAGAIVSVDELASRVRILPIKS